VVVTLLLAGCSGGDGSDVSGDAAPPSTADEVDGGDADAAEHGDASPGDLQASLSEREPLASVTVPVTVTSALDEITVSVVSFENVSDDLMRMVLRWTPDRTPDDVDDTLPTTLSEYLGGSAATGLRPYLTDPENLLEYQPVRSGTPNGTSRRFEGGAPIETVYYYGRVDADPDTVDIRIDPVALDAIQIEPIRDVPFDPVDTEPAAPAGDGLIASMVHPTTGRDELDEITISLVSFEPAGDEQVRMVLRFTPDRYPVDGTGATLSNSLGGGNAAGIAPLIIDPHGLLEYSPARGGVSNGTARRFEDGRPIDVAFYYPAFEGDPPTVDIRLTQSGAGMDNVEPLRDVPVTLDDPVDHTGASPAEDEEGVLTDAGTVLFDPALFDPDAVLETGEELERYISDLTPRDPRDLAPETVEGDTTTMAVSADVLFAFASAELTERAERTIRDLAARIDGDGPITVVGHTDSVGPDAVNQPLSEDRAAAVAAVLADELGDDREITTEGRGASDPAVRETDDESAALNRRVEISYGG
jgi:outer membrane protein OmpA-like peptidoglycan-associated protein